MTNPESFSVPKLPPYTYVPGVTPHPISDVNGHMHNQSETLHDSWPHAQWMQWGRTLFNGGYYWEAHEAWEHLWIELGRRGNEADAVKGLIKLAACGVKVLESNQAGALRHATRAAELLSTNECSSVLGQQLDVARAIAKRFVASPAVSRQPSTGQPKPLAKFVLTPS